MAKHTVVFVVVFLIACGFLVSTVVGARYRLPLIRGSNARRNVEIRGGGVVSPSTKIRKYGAKVWPLPNLGYDPTLSVTIVNSDPTANEDGSEIDSQDGSVNSEPVVASNEDGTESNNQDVGSEVGSDEFGGHSNMYSSGSETGSSENYPEQLFCDDNNICDRICKDNWGNELEDCTCSSEVKLVKHTLAGQHFCIDDTPSDNEEIDPTWNGEGKDKKKYPGELQPWSSNDVYGHQGNMV